MLPTVAVFTDTYLPTVNGVTYTIRTWREWWNRRGGRMFVVYPGADGHCPQKGEHPVRSFAFPFYEGFHVGLPGIPDAVRGADLVHAHTPFLLGLSGLRCARTGDRPLVASYHTPTAEYADYLAHGALSQAIEWVARDYERWYLNSTDAVVVPSAPAREHLRDIGVTSRVEIVPNGVDVGFFRPTDSRPFREHYELGDGPLVGYTGRHGYEKNLVEILEATDGMNATVVFAGDGPARGNLEERAAESATEVRFLGFLDREELPAFYSALSVFAFPSPVETQGLVALEANACGTPVVGANAGALAETVVDGETGYRYDPGDPEDFRAKLERTLDERDSLSKNCLDRREETSVEHAIDRLAAVYDSLL